MSSWWIWALLLGYAFLGVDTLLERRAERRFAQRIMSQKPLIPNIWSLNFMRRMHKAGDTNAP